MAFRINRVYTRTGDKGETALLGGERVLKDNPRVQAYGSIDELNSLIGWIEAPLTAFPDEWSATIADLLETIQQDLFDFGSELAAPPGASFEGMTLGDDTVVSRLEKLCDQYGNGLPELNSFLIPGGSEVSARFQVARSVCRRAERDIVSLQRDDSINGIVSVRPVVLAYVNRLSDLLFILARWVLKQEGKSEVLWVKRAERINL